MDSDSVQMFKSDNMENTKEPVEEEVPKSLSPEIRAIVRNMDSGSDGDRQEEMEIYESDNEESEEENGEAAMEQDLPKILSPEIDDVFHILAGMLDDKSYGRLAMTCKKMKSRCVPKILRDELRDVFPIFASMLDIKSFMKLARTSKDMNKRCMGTRSIKINVNVKSFTISFLANHIDIYTYNSAMRKLPCRVKLGVVFVSSVQSSTIADALRLMKKIGVETIEKLEFSISCEDCEVIDRFLENFHVNEIRLTESVPLPVLRSILSLNIKKFSYEYHADAIPIDMLLESTISEISNPSIRAISQEEFMQIVSKVQSGPLRRVTVHSDAVDWSPYEKIPVEVNRRLSEKRPLVFTGRIYANRHEYWFLNEQGDITKCVSWDSSSTLEIFKCEPWDYPLIFKTEEDVMKHLTEKRSRVFCTAAQFRTFTSTLERFSAPETRALPKERPHYFKCSDNYFWMLCKDDSLWRCDYACGSAIWKLCTPRPSDDETGDAALDKYLFWRMLQEDDRFDGLVFCRNFRKFCSWFEDFKKFDFNYSGDLPNARPLIFQGQEERILRVVLFEDRVLQCRYDIDNKLVWVEHGSPPNGPSILFKAEDVKTVLQNSFQCEEVFEKPIKIVAHKTFLGGFHQFKSSPGPYYPQKLPLVYEKTTKDKNGEIIDERWLSDDGTNVRKAIWKGNRLHLSRETFLDCPMEFMNKLFRVFAQARSNTSEVHLDHELFRCLQQFTLVPFDYSGPLKNDPPLAFVKNEIRHTCRTGPTRRPRCKCSHLVIRVWFLWEDMRTTYCSWEEEQKGSKKVVFHGSSGFQEVPPILSTKKCLKRLLKADYDEIPRFEWFGRLSDLRILLDGYKTIQPDYEGPLPNKRPLVLETEDENVSLLLREDGTVIKCDSRP